MHDKWIDVFGFEDCYQVSNTGRIKSKTRKRITRNKFKEFEKTYVGKELRVNYSERGYAIIELFNMDKYSRKSIHVIVYEAFNSLSVPKGFVVHHKDGNKRNNNIDNLEMMSIADHNRLHSHPSWNKGIKTNKKTQKKMILARTKTMLKKSQKAIELRDFWGLTVNEIAVEMGAVSRCIYDYLNKKEHYENKIKELENELSK